jgi:hypothetical protein
VIATWEGRPLHVAGRPAAVLSATRICPGRDLLIASSKETRAGARARPRAGARPGARQDSGIPAADSDLDQQIAGRLFSKGFGRGWAADCAGRFRLAARSRQDFAVERRPQRSASWALASSSAIAWAYWLGVSVGPVIMSMGNLAELFIEAEGVIKCHRAWLSQSTYNFLTEIVEKFGPPLEPITRIPGMLVLIELLHRSWKAAFVKVPLWWATEAAKAIKA